MWTFDILHISFSAIFKLPDTRKYSFGCWYLPKITISILRHLEQSSKTWGLQTGLLEKFVVEGWAIAHLFWWSKGLVWPWWSRKVWFFDKTEFEKAADKKCSLHSVSWLDFQRCQSWISNSADLNSTGTFKRPWSEIAAGFFVAND